MYYIILTVYQLKVVIYSQHKVPPLISVWELFPVPDSKWEKNVLGTFYETVYIHLHVFLRELSHVYVCCMAFIHIFNFRNELHGRMKLMLDDKPFFREFIVQYSRPPGSQFADPCKFIPFTEQSISNISKVGLLYM